MKFSCDQKDLNDALKFVSRCVKGTSPLPILNNLLLRTAEDQVWISGSDNDLTLRATFPAAIQEPGPVTLPAKLLSEIVSALPNDRVTIAEANKPYEYEKVRIQCRKSRHCLASLPGDLYPSPPKLQESVTKFYARESWLIAALRQTLLAVSKDETKPQLTGIRISVKADRIWQFDTTPVLFQACDTHRLAQRAGTNDMVMTRDDAFGSVIVPARAAGEILKTLDPKSETFCCVSFDQNHLVLETEAKRLMTRLIHGEYPAFMRVRPTQFNARWCVGRTELIQALKRVEPIAREDLSRVRLHNQGREHLILQSRQECGRAYEEIELTSEGEPLQVTFNLPFLRDALNEMEGDAVWFQFADEETPVLIRSAQDSSYEMIMNRMQPSPDWSETDGEDFP